MDTDVFILDPQFKSKLVIDEYKSLIWTERYNQYGDFEIHIPVESSSASKDLLQFNSQTKKNIWSGYYASIQGSNRLMILEQFRLTYDSDEGSILIITGRSLESILMRRIIWKRKILSGSLQAGIRQLLEDCFINPAKQERQVNNFSFVASEDPNILNLTLDRQFTGDNLYDVIVEICEKNQLGFQIYQSDGQFKFSLYFGTDRSFDQDTEEVVAFSKEMENLISSEYLESDAFLKNVTLIGGEGEGDDRVYTEIGSASGLDRREIFTDARDLSSDSAEYILLTTAPRDWPTAWGTYYSNSGTQENPVYELLQDNHESMPTFTVNTFYKKETMSSEEYLQELTKRGEKTLSENKAVNAFHGEIDPFSLYVYGRDFFIGDVVEMADEFGHSSKARVVEIIRSVDSSGLSFYPTFSLIEEDNE